MKNNFPYDFWDGQDVLEHLMLVTKKHDAYLVGKSGLLLEQYSKIVKKYKLSDFKGGWFIGNFEPTIVKTESFEVAVKHYKKGDREKAHVHRLADEFTVVIGGRCQLNGQILEKGDIAVLKKGEKMTEDFEALEDTDTTVVKIPSVIGDKYEV